MSLVHLTGEARWLDEACASHQGRLELSGKPARTICSSASATSSSTFSRTLPPAERQPAQISDELLTRMMHYLGRADRAVRNTMPCFARKPASIIATTAQCPGADTCRRSNSPIFRCSIIGAGFSGIGMAIKLEEAGIPYAILEKNQDVGGTWLENRYPGCGVDTPCHFFSYSFAPNPEWSSFFAKRDEILQYIVDCVERYGIRKSIRFGEEVIDARYDEDERRLARSHTLDRRHRARPDRQRARDRGRGTESPGGSGHQGTSRLRRARPSTPRSGTPTSI